MRTREEVQEMIKLTPAQVAAWKALKMAVQKCKKANIYFYQNLNNLGALNGNNVINVVGDDKIDGMADEEGCCLHWLDYPRVRTTCSFADDTHFVVLKD